MIQVHLTTHLTFVAQLMEVHVEQILLVVQAYVEPMLIAMATLVWQLGILEHVRQQPNLIPIVMIQMPMPTLLKLAILPAVAETEVLIIIVMVRKKVTQVLIPAVAVETTVVAIQTHLMPVVRIRLQAVAVVIHGLLLTKATLEEHATHKLVLTE